MCVCVRTVGVAGGCQVFLKRISQIKQKCIATIMNVCVCVCVCVCVSERLKKRDKHRKTKRVKKRDRHRKRQRQKKCGNNYAKPARLCEECFFLSVCVWRGGIYRRQECKECVGAQMLLSPALSPL